MKTDTTWMQEAIAEARKGWGMTSPNPMVGAVVVSGGKEVGRGYHHQAGGPHAEINALRSAGHAARGATIYVTLEPCSTSGRTPPCTEAIIAAGIRRVVFGSTDPNPRHAGRAGAIFREKGVEVTAGILAEKCNQLNEAFFHWITTGRPFVLLKMAMTLDGRIATRDGQSQWITGPDARGEVQRLRQWADAIMVGGETIHQDNPSLTVREPADWPRQPRRVVWTRKESLPANLKVNTGPGGPAQLCRAHERSGWMTWLEEQGKEEITALLVEGGGELAGDLLAAGVVNKIIFFVAPKILGGRGSRPVVAGSDPEVLSEALDIAGMSVTPIGEDWMITGYPANPAN